MNRIKGEREKEIKKSYKKKQKEIKKKGTK